MLRPPISRSSSTRLLFLTGLNAFVLSGCVATTTDVDRLQESLNRVQKGQADLIIKIDELDSSMSALNEKLDESQMKMASLSEGMGDTQSSLGHRLELISHLLTEATTQASIPVPGDIYRAAQGDYLSGKLDLAMEGFKSFLEKYPSSDLADNAQFYLADCYLIKKDFKRARIEFDKVLAQSREFRSRALLKRAYALGGSKQRKDQESTLETLVKEFPDSVEAQTAEQILKKLKKPKPKPKPKKSDPAPTNKKKAPQKNKAQ